MDFTQKMRLRGKAEEDLYFAEQDRALIEAVHEMPQKGEIDNWHKPTRRNEQAKSQ